MLFNSSLICGLENNNNTTDEVLIMIIIAMWNEWNNMK